MARVGPDDRETLAAQAGLAATQAELGELKDAEASARAAQVGYRRIEAADARGALKASNTLARVLLRLGTPDRLAEAQQLLSASAARASSRAPNDFERLTHEQLGVQLRIAQGRQLEAEPLARQAYQQTLSALGPRHPLTLEAFDTVSNLLLSLGRYAELLQTQQQHADESRRVLGGDHIVTLRAQATIAETLRQLDRFEDAKKLYDQVLADKVRVLGETHRSTLLSRHNVALLYKDLKEPAKAEQMLRDLARVQTTVLGPEHEDTLDTEMMIAADALHAEADGRVARRGTPPCWRASGQRSARVLSRISSAQPTLRVCCNRLGDYDGAERTLRECLKAHQRVYGDHYYGTYYVMSELGTTLVHKQQFAEAETLLVASLKGFRNIYADQPSHQRVQQALDRLEQLYRTWNQPEKAAEYRALLNKAKEAASGKAKR